jgi:hypothetical protein
MENTVCEFEILQNPSKKYASTVNLVFFRAYPLTKNFQNYVNGLSKWKTYIKYFPDCQLQIFIDDSIINNKKIQNLLKDIKARVYYFKCPKYFSEDNYHLGLFGTLIRFYPMFDINTHSLKVAHIQDIEPIDIDNDYIKTCESFNKIGNMSHGAALVYNPMKFFDENYYTNKYKFDNDIYYPWILAGKFSVFDKVPFKIFTDYLEDIENGKKFYNMYEHIGKDIKKIEHGKYSFGIDESFLNNIYLEYLIKNDMTIGIFIKYKLINPIYQLENKVLKHKDSKNIFKYILDKEGDIGDLIKTFYNLFNSKNETEMLIDPSKRFYEVIEKYPNWLGNHASNLILTFFKNYIYRECIILIKDNKVIDIKDLK